jgi:glutamate-ammonia-ligase adenylyltransferase
MTATALLSSAYSSFTARAIAARPELNGLIADWARAPITREHIDARLNALAALERQARGSAETGPLDEDALRRVLRRLRVEVFCAVMERDLAGLADVDEVTGTMTDLA